MASHAPWVPLGSLWEEATGLSCGPGDGSRVECWSSFLAVPTRRGGSELKVGPASVTLGFCFIF